MSQDSSCKYEGTNSCKIEDDLMECKTELGQQMEAMRGDLQEMKKTIMEVSEMLLIFKNAKGFITTVGWLGTFVKRVSLVGIALGGLYVALTKLKW